MMKHRFTRSIFIALAICLPIVSIALSAAPVPANALTARQIMEKVDARDDGDNMTADMEMILIDKNGHERVRKIKTFSKDRGNDTLKIMFFLMTNGSIKSSKKPKSAATRSGSSRPFHRTGSLKTAMAIPSRSSLSGRISSWWCAVSIG